MGLAEVMMADYWQCVSGIEDGDGSGMLQMWNRRQQEEDGKYIQRRGEDVE